MLADIAVHENELAEFNYIFSPQNRKRYGNIDEQKRLLVNKVYDYNKIQPNLSVTGASVSLVSTK